MELNNQTQKPILDFSTLIQNNEAEPSQEIKEFDNGKFYFDIISELKAKNFPLEVVQKYLKIIDSKYPNTNTEKSTSFRFLVLLHQILHEKNLQFYRDKYGDNFINNAFGHLIEIFENNFRAQNLNSNDLLRNNILYFMIINIMR